MARLWQQYAYSKAKAREERESLYQKWYVVLDEILLFHQFLLDIVLNISRGDIINR